VSFGKAAACGLGAVFLGTMAYDMWCRSPLGRHEALTAAAGFLGLVALSYGLGRVLSARAAWIHVGATMGTVMVANVWNLILPTQKRMIAEIQAGRRLEPALEDRAMQRTKHNTYLSIPVVLIMISNHFPTVAYGNAWSPLVLGVLLLVGAGAAHVIRRI
jgi:uncharacterized membrane protein